MTMLPPSLIQALSQASAALEIIVELELGIPERNYWPLNYWPENYFMDSYWQVHGTLVISQTKAHGIPILKSASNILHKLQTQYGKASIARLTVDLIDEEEWGPMVSGNYLKNRRANAKVGIRGGASASFYTFFTGLIVNFSVDAGVLTIEIQDDLYVAKDKVPEENATNTQTLALQNMNPIDIKRALIETYGGVPLARIDTDAFDYEEASIFPGWYFDRVLTRTEAIKNLINELDEQTLNTVFSDGDKITLATFGPRPPGTELLHLDSSWRTGTLQYDGAMDDSLVNLCVVYFDYDESGSDGEENYDSVAFASNAASQSAAEWNEVARKVIKSKWLRSFTIAQPSNITGVVIYHCNPQNGAGTGTLAYNAANQTLTWTAPGDAAGTAVEVDKDGRFQLFSLATTSYIRVVVTYASLPVGNQNDSLAITALPGAQLAGVLASHWVARYADPQAEVKFDLDMAEAVHQDRFLTVADIVKISSPRIFTKGCRGWDQENIVLSSVRPDFEKKRFQVTGLQTAFKKRYGYIGPVTLLDDYDDASEADREYAFVGNSNNRVGTYAEDGYYIW